MNTPEQIAEKLRQRFEPQPSGTQLVYERQLFQARFSPDGEFLIAGGYDATVQRWHVRGPELELMEPLTGHQGWVQCLGFHPQQCQLLTADSWGRLACWLYAEASPQPQWRLADAHDGWIRALAVSPDGCSVATGGNDPTVRIRSTHDGTLNQELAHPVRVFSLCFHPGGGSLVSGDLQGVIRHWDLQTGQVVRQLDAGTLYAHDVANERIQHCGGARHLAFDAQGSRLACAGQKDPSGGFANGLPCVLVYDWETGQQIREMQVGGTQDGFAFDAQFHPAGFVMATSCAFPGKGHIWFWRPEDEQAFYTSSKIPNGRSLSLHADGHRLALLVSHSPNRNGRALKDGKYEGGSAKIHLLEVPAGESGQ